MLQDIRGLKYKIQDLKLQKKEKEEKIVAEEYQRVKKLSDINTLRNKFSRSASKLSTTDDIANKLQFELERKDKELDDLS